MVIKWWDRKAKREKIKRKKTRKSTKKEKNIKINEFTFTFQYAPFK